MLKTRWQKSTHSASDCVEARRRGSHVQLRDSKAGDTSPVLDVTAAAWSNLLGAIRTGDLSAA